MIVQNWQIPLQAVLSKLFVRPNFCFMQYKMSAEMLRHKMKSTTQIVFSWSLYVYLSEGWKCLFLRYKTDMQKSISESSKEETDRAQKVYVGWLLFFGRLWSSGSFMGYFHLPYLLFPWRRRRVSDPVTNTFWITNSVPARAAAAGFALWRWEKLPGERTLVLGVLSEEKWQCSLWERSHDLHYILAAAKVGARWTLASRVFGITLWSLKQSLL